MSIDAEKQIDDLKFLTQEFKKEFSFESNVNISVTFQRFDPEWDEYVDLDPASELGHKDKLVVVVTPILVTPPLSSVGCKQKSVSYMFMCVFNMVIAKR